MCVEWGIRKADEMRLEAYVEAGPIAKRVHESYGFVEVDSVSMNVETMNPLPRDKWKRHADDLTAMPTSIMWRPIGWNFEKVKTVTPWEGQPKEE